MRIQTSIIAIALAALAGGVSSSCTAAVETVMETVLCGGCGEIKGGEVCCAENAEQCDGCELTKGSPGCCKIAKGTDVTMCSDCGQVKGSEVCCDADAAKCDGCGMAKGSPLCRR